MSGGLRGVTELFLVFNLFLNCKQIFLQTLSYKFKAFMKTLRLCQSFNTFKAFNKIFRLCQSVIIKFLQMSSFI